MVSNSRHSPPPIQFQAFAFNPFIQISSHFFFSLGVLTVWQLCHRGSNGFCTTCTCTAAPFLRATLVAVCLVGAGLAGCFLAYIIAPTGRFNRVVSPFVPGTFDGFQILRDVSSTLHAVPARNPSVCRNNLFDKLGFPRFVYATFLWLTVVTEGALITTSTNSVPMVFSDKYPFNNTTGRFQEISANTEFLSKSRPWPSMLAWRLRLCQLLLQSRCETLHY